VNVLRTERLRHIITVAASATVMIAGGAYAAAAGTVGQRNAGPASEGKPFTIAGRPTGPVAPGRTAHLNLALTNPNGRAIRVTSITVCGDGHEQRRVPGA
jgi:hypothetical protein